MSGLIDSIDKNEVLRYLGYRGTPPAPQIESLVDMCISRTLEVIAPRFLYRRFAIERAEDGLYVSGTDVVLSGMSISEHLYNCDELYLMCVTIGGELDRLVRLKMATAPDEGVVYDSCGSAAVEKLADEVEKMIAAEAEREGTNTTWRFSPDMEICRWRRREQYLWRWMLTEGREWRLPAECS